MDYTYFSHNGTLLPADQAVIPLSNIEYSYGFGVYESIRVAAGVTYFLDEHTERLMESARIIGLDHSFNKHFVVEAIEALVAATNVPAYNLKVLLIGGHSAETANLYITCLNPHFPDRALYRRGAQLVSEQAERLYPQAKSLNMFMSYMAYRRAQQKGAYDALLVNRVGQITEGTRTNFFGLNGHTLFSPPAQDCLHGVTRHNVITVAKTHGFTVTETPMKFADVGNYENVFITSTASKIMPIRSIDDITWEQPVSAALDELMKAYDDYMATYREHCLQQHPLTT